MFTYILAALLIIHGLFHILGFLIFFRFIESEEIQYSTQVLGGRLDVGDLGMRVLGLIWLLVLVGMVAAGIGLLLGISWWFSAAMWSTLISTVVLVIGLPDTRVGLLANALIFILLFVGRSQGWY